VVALVGDGSMSMMMGDLVTLAQHGLPVKIIVIKNNTLGLIKWEQMVFLGNPEYGVDLAPIDFVKVAEACGCTGIRIDDPRKCHAHLREALAHKGPVVVEAVTDPLEPPQPPEITRDQEKKLAKALARGEESRVRIGLTIGRQFLQEADYSQSPLGFVARAKEKLHLGHGKEKKEEGESDAGSDENK
jgi:pyruvate dehydrogenase (quinone)/pyruvate oxidase